MHCYLILFHILLPMAICHDSPHLFDRDSLIVRWEEQPSRTSGKIYHEVRINVCGEVSDTADNAYYILLNNRLCFHLPAQGLILHLREGRYTIKLVHASVTQYRSVVQIKSGYDNHLIYIFR
jgi:hypothetical protein